MPSSNVTYFDVIFLHGGVPCVPTNRLDAIPDFFFFLTQDIGPIKQCANASVFLSFPFDLGRILFHVLFSFVCHFSGGGARHFPFLLFIFFYYFICFFVSSVFTLPTHLFVVPVVPSNMAGHCIVTALQCRIYVSWFCNHKSCLISRGGRIGTDTGCAACRRVERTFFCEAHTTTEKVAIYIS